MEGLSKPIARKIIEVLGESGQPPVYGHHFFSCGLDPYLNIIDAEYLKTYIKDGGASFKIVEGMYGGGKTHFLYSIRNLAWQERYIVSYVTLKSQESPFYKLELVYKAIVNGLIAPQEPEKLLSPSYEKGISSLIDFWIQNFRENHLDVSASEEEQKEMLEHELDNVQGIESTSFSKAVKNAFKQRYYNNDEGFETICQWLQGEGYDRRLHGHFGIYERIDKTTAFKMIRSLVRWINQIGFSGIVILFDEAEPKTHLSGKDKSQLVSNLREIIDACANSSFLNVMVFYSIPDMSLLESGNTAVYEALRQRITTVFEELNPTGVRIQLETVVLDALTFLNEVGSRISEIYQVAYDCTFNPKTLDDLIKIVAKESYSKRFADIGYKRVFVKGIAGALNFYRIKGTAPSTEELRIS